MNECVLVVDDDREIARAIAVLLEKEGYQATIAADGTQGRPWNWQWKSRCSSLSWM